MTLDKARQLLQVQVGFGGGRNRQGARLIIDEVARVHGQEAANHLISEMQLEALFGFSPVQIPKV